MKKLSLLFILLFSVTLTIVSCKKKETATIEKTTLQKLQGKWTFVSGTFNEHNSGKDNFLVTNGESGNYWEFKSDNKLDVYSPKNGVESNTYSIIGDNTLTLNNSVPLTIKVLTNNTLEIYFKGDTDSNGHYSEFTYILSR